MPTTTDLYTRLKNTSGVTKFFGFLGRHGTRLAADATIDLFGRPENQPGWNERKQAAYERALLSVPPQLSVIATPREVIPDTLADAALANPTVAATVAVTGGGATGGALPAGHYRVSYAFYNAWGQTIAGGESADFNVGATNIPRVTLPAIPAGAIGIKIYLSDVSVGAVAAGAAKKYFNKIITGTTYDLNSTLWNQGTQTFLLAPAAPTTNNTLGHPARVLSVADDAVISNDPSWHPDPVPGASIVGVQGSQGFQGAAGS